MSSSKVVSSVRRSSNTGCGTSGLQPTIYEESDEMCVCEDVCKVCGGDVCGCVCGDVCGCVCGDVCEDVCVGMCVGMCV